MIQENMQQKQNEDREKPQIKKEIIEEFSIKWHLKVLTIIYVILGVLYLILKFTLK